MTSPATEVRRESPEVRDAVREAVRSVLSELPSFTEAPADQRKSVANQLVNVGLVAARLLEEDERLTRQIETRSKPATRGIARAQSAGDQLGMQAVRSAGDTVRSLRDSIAFPEFVQSLITGTFQAILTSSTVQLGSLGELLDNVAASSDEFSETIQDNEVRGWAIQRFPFLQISDGAVTMRDPERDIHEYDAQLRAALGGAPEEIGGVDGSDIEGTLLPLVRRKMGRDRQGILATLVQLGLQRIVVDDGRLEASMDLRVDAQSSSQQDTQQRDDFRVNAGASGSFGFGPWGASAQASTSVGRVRSDQQYTAEQIAARAGLRSSVQLAFRTEQVPLDRMSNEAARVRISQNARVPDVGASAIIEGTQNISGSRVPNEIPTVPTAPAIPTTPDAQRMANEQAFRMANAARPPTGTTAPPPTGTTAPPPTGTTARPPTGTTAPPPTGTTAPPPTGTTAPPPTGTTAPPTGTTAPPTGTTAPPTGTTAPPPTGTTTVAPVR